MWITFIYFLHFTRMWTEFKATAKRELLHSLFMIRIALAGPPPDIDWDNIGPDSFSQAVTPNADHIRRLSIVISLFDKYDLL